MNFFKSSSDEKAEIKRQYEEEEDLRSVISSTPITRDNVLVCATHGHIFALHKSNGGLFWKTKFLSAQGGVISLYFTDNDELLVGTKGKTASLDFLTGTTLEMKKIPGFALEDVSITSATSKFISPKKDQTHGAGAPPNYNEHVLLENPIVLACTEGNVMAMDINNGEALWIYGCPGESCKIPTALIEPSSAEDDGSENLVYIGNGKWVSCLKSRTGEVVWKTKITETSRGSGYMTMATPWSSRLTSEAYTAFCPQPRC